MTRRPKLRRGRPAVHGDREAILAAAVKVVAEDGLDDLSKNRLAEKLGCSPFVLTYHFGGREKLLAAIIEHTEERFRAMLVDIAAQRAADGPQLLRSYWNDLPIHDRPNYVRLWVEVILRASREPEKYPNVGRRAMIDWIKLVGDNWCDGDDQGRGTLVVAALIGLEILGAFDTDLPSGQVLQRLTDIVSSPASETRLH